MSPAFVSHDGVPIDTTKPKEQLRPEVGGETTTPIEDLIKRAQLEAEKQSSKRR